jgi:uncharacterized protein
MARPVKCRKICCGEESLCFAPLGAKAGKLPEVVMTLDELEAVRLVDMEKKYHAEAALSMGVSRQTLGNIVESARAKIAEAVIKGKVLAIRGGAVQRRKQAKKQAQS